MINCILTFHHDPIIRSLKNLMRYRSRCKADPFWAFVIGGSHCEINVFDKYLFGLHLAPVYRSEIRNLFCAFIFYKMIIVNSHLHPISIQISNNSHFQKLNRQWTKRRRNGKNAKLFSVHVLISYTEYRRLQT